MTKLFERSFTTITISEFYDNYKNDKYNFEPTYQRKSGVWNQDKQSFLIDSIFKNYPIPSVFMRPIIDKDTGLTKYDVIDGKQRLQAIIRFIEGEIPITSYFTEDVFFAKLGDKKVLWDWYEAPFFNDIKENTELSLYLKQFWTYSFKVEYLYEDDSELISSVFDRLNRNGEPLTPQELRNARFAESIFLKTIKELTQNAFLSDKLVRRLRIERMEDEEFVSELFLLVIENDFFDSKPATIDSKYEKYRDDIETINRSKQVFERIVDIVESLRLDFDRYKRLCWTTHLYTIFSLGWFCENQRIDVSLLSDKVNDFYDKYFMKTAELDSFIERYREAATSRTKSAMQRRTRLEVLLDYCGIDY